MDKTKGKSMKIISILFLILLPLSNIYTQEQGGDAEKKEEHKFDPVKFEAAVEKEVDRRLRRMKAKNIEQFARELLAKEKALEKREKLLADREGQLTFNEQTLEKKVKDLEGRQQKLLGCIDGHDKEAKGRVDHLVKIISGMRPAKAAEVLSVQDSEISVKILSSIESIKASKIFNLMDKEISARLQKEYMSMKRLP